MILALLLLIVALQLFALGMIALKVPTARLTAGAVVRPATTTQDRASLPTYDAVTLHLLRVPPVEITMHVPAAPKKLAYGGATWVQTTQRRDGSWTYTEHREAKA
jgi:hypothetical protein